MSEIVHSDRLSPVAKTDSTAIVRRRLSLHTRIGPDAADDLERLLGRPTRFAAGSLIAEAGDMTDLVTVVREGFAGRTGILPDGRRQIHSLMVPGDTADAEAPLLGARPDNIEALSDCSVWLAPKSRLAGLIAVKDELAEAFVREAAIAAQVAREWVVNVGRRTAVERVAHLICELHARLDAVGLVQASGFVQPLTQQHIADAQGISTVHANRVMQELRAMGLIRTDKRRLTVLNLERLQNVAMFDPLYLHLKRG